MLTDPYVKTGEFWLFSSRKNLAITAVPTVVGKWDDDMIRGYRKTTQFVDYQFVDTFFKNIFNTFLTNFYIIN